MMTLQQEGKKNLLYSMSKCFEKRQDDTTMTRMPLNQMPFGLIDYNVRFFLRQTVPKSLVLKTIMHSGSQQCLHILATNGCVYFEDLVGNTMFKKTTTTQNLKIGLNAIPFYKF